MRRFIRKLAIGLVILLFAAAGYYIYDTFRERTYAEKVAEIIHYEDIREFSSGLREYLQDDNPDVRAKAALAIGRIGAAGSAELLFGLVTSESMDVAAKAAFALGLTGEKEYAVKLLELAFDYPSKLGGVMVEAAGRLADSSMVDAIDMLGEFLSHPSPEVRQAACMALYRANAKNAGMELMSFIENEPDEEVQVTALYALARLSVKEATDVYIKYFADADNFVRSLAVRGLGLSDSKDAVHYLMIALNDSDHKVVAQAIKELAKKKSQQARRKLVQKLQKERNELLVVELINALRQQNNADGVEPVNTLLLFNPSANIVAAAVKYLATVLNDRAVSFIDSVVLLDNSQIKAAAAEAFGIINSKNVIPRLAVLFSDNNVIVRTKAFESLIKIDSGNIDFYLEKALDDSSYILPVMAVDEIKKRQLSTYLPRLYNLMKQVESVYPDIRRSIIEAVHPFIKKSDSNSLARQILIKGILDSEYIVRHEAAKLYKELLSENRFNMVPPAKTRISKRKIEKAMERFITNPYALIHTNKGEIELELYFDTAPLTVMNFIELVEDDFYEGLIFHRVVSNFVVQGGDPQGNGWGGPSYYIRCEYSDRPYIRGTVGIATSGKDTGGSQFFITHSPQPHLEARYTVFGQVLTGMEVVDQFVPGDTINKIIITEGIQL